MGSFSDSHMLVLLGIIGRLIVPDWNGFWTKLLSFAASDAVTSRKANDTSY